MCAHYLSMHFCFAWLFFFLVILLMSKNCMTKNSLPISYCYCAQKTWVENEVFECLLKVNSYWNMKTLLHSIAQLSVEIAENCFPVDTEAGLLRKPCWSCRDREHSSAVTRIRTWVVSATTRSTNHYTITAIASALIYNMCALLYDFKCEGLIVLAWNW